MSFGAGAPYWYYEIEPTELENRVELSSDQCVIDSEYYFVRGCLNIPIIDGVDPFVWGVWVSLSADNFLRMSEVWESPTRQTEPPYFGWLSTTLPGYPDTLNLKTNVHTQPVGTRPLVELEPTDHPLAIDQRTGITWRGPRDWRSVRSMARPSQSADRRVDRPY